MTELVAIVLVVFVVATIIAPLLFDGGRRRGRAELDRLPRIDTRPPSTAPRFTREDPSPVPRKQAS